MIENKARLQRQIADYLTAQFVYSDIDELPTDECLDEADQVIRFVIESLLAEQVRIPVGAGTSGVVTYSNVPLLCDWDRQKLRDRIPALSSVGKDER